MFRLASLYNAMGYYAKAEPLYVQAREIHRKAFGEDHPDYAATLNNLALLYKWMGDYAKAEPLYLQAREIDKKVLGEEHPSYAVSLNNLASLYQSMGDYTKAEPLFVQALEIRKRVLGEDHPDYAVSLNNLGYFYKSMGDYSKAEPLYVQAREIRKRVLGEDHPDYATTLNDLALLYKSKGDYAKAETLHIQAQSIRKKVLGEEHPKYATTLNSLAGLYKSMGDYSKAEPLYAQAREIRRKAFGEEHPSYATSLNNLALLYKSMGDYAKAEPLYVQALDIKKKVLGEVHPSYALTLNNLAALYRSMGDYSKAEPLYVEALILESKITREVLASTSEAQALNYLAAESPYVGGLLSVSLHLDKPQGDAYPLVLPARRLLYRATAQRNRQLHLLQSEASQQTKQHFRDYQLARRRIGELILSAAETDQKRAQKRKQELTQLSDEKELLERRLAATLPDLASTLEGNRDQAADLLKHLPMNAVFVDLVRYRRFDQNPNAPGRKGKQSTPSYAAFVLHRNQPIARVDLGPAKPIDEAARAWRVAIAKRQPETNPAQTLSRLVWRPLAKELPGGVETVYLCPDASLATISWAALPTGKGNRVVLEDFAVAVVPHGQFLLRRLTDTSSKRQEGNLAPVAQSDERLLVVGDVSYDRRSSSEQPKPILLAQGTAREAVMGGKQLQWPALPGTTAEISEIAGLADQRPLTGLSGNSATSVQVLANLPKSTYAHFATHGFFADKRFRSYLQVREENFDEDRGFGQIGNRSTFAGRNPLVLSGLVFAGANLPRQKDEYGIPTDDGGILSAEAIASLPLYDLKLAVLSACETGLGDVAGGEGAYGLQSAFHVAGAHNVIASLWKVDDQATAALMRLFYYKLWTENKPPIEALRESQLALYHYPEQIKKLSTSRGPDFSKTVQLVGRKPVEPKSKNSPTRLWAAFVLSGAGQ